MKVIELIELLLGLENQEKEIEIIDQEYGDSNCIEGILNDGTVYIIR